MWEKYQKVKTVLSEHHNSDHCVVAERNLANSTAGHRKHADCTALVLADGNPADTVVVGNQTDGTVLADSNLADGTVGVGDQTDGTGLADGSLADGTVGVGD